MREIVVDASVCAKWVIEEDYSAKAISLLHYDARHAPDHWQVEAVNVLWSKVIKRDLTSSNAEVRMMVLLRAPVASTPVADLMRRAFAISVAIHDSLYPALAENRNIQLVTADQGLIRRMSSDVALARRLVWVGDLPG